MAHPQQNLVLPAAEPAESATPDATGNLADKTTIGDATPARLAAIVLVLAGLFASALGLVVWGGPLWRRATGGLATSAIEPPRAAPALSSAAPPTARSPAPPTPPLSERERYLAWYAKAGPNGRCVRCGHAMKVPIHGTHRYLCPACGVASPARSIRAMGAPPPPRTPPAAYYLAPRR